MKFIKKIIVWILVLLTLNLCVSSGIYAASNIGTDTGNNTPDKVTVYTPKDKASSIEDIPGQESWFSKYKWWLLAGLVVVGGGAAAAGGGGGGGGSTSAPGTTDTASVTVGW